MNLKQLVFVLVVIGIVSCSEDFDGSSPSLDNNSAEDTFSNGTSGGEETADPTATNEIVEIPFVKVDDEAISTFSIDADGASYSNMRRQLQDGQLPVAASLRTEELVNFFNYDYPEPTGDVPISLSGEVSSCPWDDEHLLMSIGIKGAIF